MNAFRLLAVLIPLFTSGGGRGVAAAAPASTFVPDFYVSMSGSALNDGLTPATAWTPQHAFSPAGAGATIAARFAANELLGYQTKIGFLGGDYDAAVGTAWTLAINVGTAALPIIWREMPGQRVTWDSLDTTLNFKLFRVTGNYNWVWGCEYQFTGSLDRTSEQVGGDQSNPTDIGGRPQKSVKNEARGTKFINPIIHDTANGFEDQHITIAFESEIYGALIYNVGWLGMTRAHGHLIYHQNRDSWKRVTDCIMFSSYDAGVKLGGSGDAYLRGFDLDGNTVFNAGGPGDATWGREWNVYLVGGGSYSDPNGMNDNHFRNGVIWHKDDIWGVSIHVGDPDNTPVGIFEIDNVISQGQLDINEGSEHHVTNIVQTSGDRSLSGGERLMKWRENAAGPYPQHTHDNNQFFSLIADTFAFLTFDDVNGGVIRSFAIWKSYTGFDTNSTYTQGKKSGKLVRVRPNFYEAGRASPTGY